MNRADCNLEIALDGVCIISCGFTVIDYFCKVRLVGALEWRTLKLVFMPLSGKLIQFMNQLSKPPGLDTGNGSTKHKSIFLIHTSALRAGAL